MPPRKKPAKKKILPVMPTGSKPNRLNWLDVAWAAAHKVAVLAIGVVFKLVALLGVGAVAAADEIKTNGVQMVRMIPDKGWWMAGALVAVCVLVLQYRRDNSKPAEPKPEVK